MVNQEITNLLKIGLTEGEAKVYLALSELGSSTVGPIVKKSTVAYSNIYDILNRLIDKGIVSFILKNKTKYFQAASPSNLAGFLDKKEKEVLEQKETLKQILPSLEKLQEKKTSEKAEVFLGKKGLRTAYEKLSKDVTKNDELLFFYIHEEKYGEEANLFYNSITELFQRTKSKGICNKNYKGSWFAKKAKHLDIKYTEIPIPGIIDIVKNKVLITSWKNTIFSTLIESESLAHSLREYFEHMWKIAKK